MSTKKHDPGVAMVKNARRRLTCENASNLVHFTSPGVALLTPWMQNSFKIVETQRWGPNRRNSWILTRKLFESMQHKF